MWNQVLHKDIRHMLSFTAVFFLFVLFFTNTPPDLPAAAGSPSNVLRTLDEEAGPQTAAALQSSDRTFVETASREDAPCERSENSLTNAPARNSISFRTMRLLLLLCISGCLVHLFQCGFHRLSPLTAFRSQRFIILYIHNTDGKKG